MLIAVMENIRLLGSWEKEDLGRCFLPDIVSQSSQWPLSS